MSTTTTRGTVQTGSGHSAKSIKEIATARSSSVKPKDISKPNQAQKIQDKLSGDFETYGHAANRSVQQLLGMNTSSAKQAKAFFAALDGLAKNGVLA